MTKEEAEAVIAEIEDFRAELRKRSEEHDRRMRMPNSLDLPAIDVTQLDLPQIRALIAQKYEHARLERRLSEVEKRLAEVEARDD